MAGPSTLPGPLGQIDRIHYGTRLNVFWYGETKSSKKPQNDLSIDLSGSGWFQTIVVNHPVVRTVFGQTVTIVVLVDLDRHTNHPSDGIWVDALGDATYGDDFCGGKMWHFAEEHKMGTLDAWKAKCKASDLNVDKIKAYLDVRNRTWEMYPTFDDVFTAGSVAPLWPAPPPPAPPFWPAPPSSASPIWHPHSSAPCVVAPYALAAASSPLGPSKDNNTSDVYEIELLAARLREVLYKNGEAIMKSKTRNCTVCKFTGTIAEEDMKEGILVPACLLGDRKYFKEQDNVFRFSRTSKGPAIFNGFSVCVGCANASTGVHFLKIAETNKICILCLNRNRTAATMVCSTCNEQVKATNKSESGILRHLLEVLPHVFPHYRISLGPGKFDFQEFTIDYHLDAQYYDGLSGTWKKIKILFELDQDCHAGYGLWDEKTRLVRVLRGTLDTHAKVVMLRLNHTDDFEYPPGFSSAADAVLDKPNFHLRFVVLRHWVLYFLQKAPDLPPATLLYMYYRYQSTYDAKYGDAKDERRSLTEEDDIKQDSGATPPGQERLSPLWKHACTGFAFSSPPVREVPEQVNWRYYVTSAEYKDCNPDDPNKAAKIGPTLVGKMQAACEKAKYQPFPMGLRSDMPKFPSMASLDEAFHVAKKSGSKKAKKA